jgi:hypothetical protein
LPENATVTLSRPLDARSRRVDFNEMAFRYLHVRDSLARRVTILRFPRLTWIVTRPRQASAADTSAGRRRRPVKT